MNWLDQNKRIAENVISYVVGNSMSMKRATKLLNENTYPSPAWFGDKNTKWTKEMITRLSRVSLGGLKNPK